MIITRLYVIDISGLVYHAVTGGGQYTSSSNTFHNTIYQLPAAGIKEALDKIAFALGEGSDVVVCFDSRDNFRKKLLPTYKKGRIPIRDVYVQLDFLYEVLTTANIACLKVDTYEADDLINWVVQSNYQKYSEVIIMSGDMDIAHNVHSNIRLEPFVKSRPIIKENNFELAVKRGEKIMFNTISAYKTFCGDQSDAVPVFKSTNGKKSKELYTIFTNILINNNKTDYVYTSSKEVMSYVIENMPIFSEEDRAELRLRMQIFYPAEKPEDVNIRVSNKNTLNKRLFVELLSLFGRFTSLRWLNADKVEADEKLIQLVKDYAYRFNTGAYAVDNNLEVNPSYVVDSEMCFLNEF